MTDRKPFSTWPVITVVLIGISLLYVASFGPACWFATGRYEHLLPVVYRPLFWSWECGPRVLGDWIVWYGNLGLSSQLLVEGEAQSWVRNDHLDPSQTERVEF